MTTRMTKRPTAGGTPNQQQQPQPQPQRSLVSDRRHHRSTKTAVASRNIVFFRRFQCSLLLVLVTVTTRFMLYDVLRLYSSNMMMMMEHDNNNNNNSNRNSNNNSDTIQEQAQQLLLFDRVKTTTTTTTTTTADEDVTVAATTDIQAIGQQEQQQQQLMSLEEAAVAVLTTSTTTTTTTFATTGTDTTPTTLTVTNDTEPDELASPMIEVVAVPVTSDSVPMLHDANNVTTASDSTNSDSFTTTTTTTTSNSNNNNNNTFAVEDDNETPHNKVWQVTVAHEPRYDLLGSFVIPTLLLFSVAQLENWTMMILPFAGSAQETMLTNLFAQKGNLSKDWGNGFQDANHRADYNPMELNDRSYDTMGFFPPVSKDLNIRSTYPWIRRETIPRRGDELHQVCEEARNQRNNATTTDDDDDSNECYILLGDYPFAISNYMHANGGYDAFFTPTFCEELRTKFLVNNRDRLEQYEMRNNSTNQANGIEEEEGEEEEAGVQYFNVAVHIRRGDILDPSRWIEQHVFANVAKHICETNTAQNSVNETTSLRTNIHVFSAGPNRDGDWSLMERLAQPMGNETNFVPPVCANVYFHMDEMEFDSWSFFVAADALIISPSTFSYVPALIRYDNVYFPRKFWHPMLSSFIIFDDDGHIGSKDEEVSLPDIYDYDSSSWNVTIAHEPRFDLLGSFVLPTILLYGVAHRENWTMLIFPFAGTFQEGMLTDLFAQKGNLSKDWGNGFQDANHRTDYNPMKLNEHSYDTMGFFPVVSKDLDIRTTYPWIRRLQIPSPGRELNQACTEGNMEYNVTTNDCYILLGDNPPEISNYIYQNNGIDQFFTPELCEEIRAQFLLKNSNRLEQYEITNQSSRSESEIGSYFNVAVHIRRGDINVESRWIEQQVFANVAKHICQSNTAKNESIRTNIHVFSAGPNHDGNWSIMERLAEERVEDDDVSNTTTAPICANVYFHIDEMEFDSWTYFIAADALVISPSTFSYIPALIRHDNVYYPKKFWHPISSAFIIYDDIDGSIVT